MSGLLQGWIGCLNSQEWCSGLQAFFSISSPLFFTLFFPPHHCSCSATAVKGFQGRYILQEGGLFTFLLPLRRLICTEKKNTCVSCNFKLAVCRSLYSPRSLIQLTVAVQDLSHIHVRLKRFNISASPPVKMCLRLKDYLHEYFTLWPRAYQGLTMNKHVG